MTRHPSDQRMDLISANEVAELKARIECRLTRPVYDFHLVVARGGLILRGRVESYYDKQLVQHAVMTETDLRILANRIEVSPD